jgi:hypothetical protein
MKLGSIYILNDSYRIVAVRGGRTTFDPVVVNFVLTDERDVIDEIDIRLHKGIAAPGECVVACGGSFLFYQSTVIRLKYGGTVPRRYLPFFTGHADVDRADYWSRLQLMRSIKRDMVAGVYDCK